MSPPLRPCRHHLQSDPSHHLVKIGPRIITLLSNLLLVISLQYLYSQHSKYLPSQFPYLLFKNKNELNFYSTDVTHCKSHTLNWPLPRTAMYQTTYTLILHSLTSCPPQSLLGDPYCDPWSSMILDLYLWCFHCFLTACPCECNFVFHMIIPTLLSHKHTQDLCVLFLSCCI